MTTTIERAGIAFEFSFFDDGDERGPRTGFELYAAKLVDAAEFTAATELPPTPENVEAYVKKHEGDVGEEALEKHQRDAAEDFDDDDCADEGDDW